MKLRDYKAAVEFVLSRPLSDFDEYKSLSDADVKLKRKEFVNSLNDLVPAMADVVKRGQNCTNDYKSCEPYALTFPFLELPEIGGEMLTVAQMEEKLTAIEKSLSERGLLGDAVATLKSASIDRLDNHRIDGLVAPTRGDGTLYLNTDNGNPVLIGGAKRAPLQVNGDIQLVGDKAGTLSSKDRLHIAGGEYLYLLNKNGVIVSKSWQGSGNLAVEGDTTIRGNIGTHGASPQDGLPPNWGGGVHTWDVFAEGQIGCGNPNEDPKAWMTNTGEIHGTVKKFVIDHPTKAGAQLVHAAIEGPEIAVYYRGEGLVRQGCACIELPAYFESLTRRDGRTVHITPVSSDGEPAVALSTSPVVEGRFFVRTLDGALLDQRFYWEVKAIRADLDILDVENEGRT
jgi:hypothetical protein